MRGSHPFDDPRRSLSLGTEAYAAVATVFLLFEREREIERGRESRPVGRLAGVLCHLKPVVGVPLYDIVRLKIRLGMLTPSVTGAGAS